MVDGEHFLDAAEKLGIYFPGNDFLMHYCLLPHGSSLTLQLLNGDQNSDSIC